MSDEIYHIPVMSKELEKYLRIRRGGTVLDCTIGGGGHASEILNLIGSHGRLIGIDQDEEALKIARDRLKSFNNFVLIQGNFRNIDVILDQINVDKVDGMVFDLGVSSLQLEKAERGFSFKYDSPLDMRMDRNTKLSAFDLVNFLPQEWLADIFKKYGEIRWHNRIAWAIVGERKKSMIVSTRQLADLVRRVVPTKYRKIHPATLVFQSLRIAVNDELGALQEGLNKCIGYLRSGARICVISFHSLEDRIVKNQFKKFAKEGKVNIITKKPITPSLEEVSVNPRARSAKLRVAERN